MSGYRILRDAAPAEAGAAPAGSRDPIAGQCFASYDEAYAVLERYYADLCCSDDRLYYSIEEESAASPRR